MNGDVTMPKKKPELNWKTAYEVWKERQTLKRLSTSTPIDELIGGGIEECEVVEFYGEYGVGKTQIAFTLITHVAGKLGEDVVLIDCETTFKPERIVQIAEARGFDPEKVLQKIHLIQPMSVDEQMEALNLIPKNVKPKLLIVDGTTTLLRAEYIGREQLPKKQGLLRRFLRNLKSYVRENKIYGIITNQVYANPDGSPFLPLELRELAVGGHTLYHLIDNRIFIRKGAKGTRIARLVDSSRYPPAERPFIISEKGIEPIRKEG